MPFCEPACCCTKLTGLPRPPIIFWALEIVASFMLAFALLASCERSTLPDWSSENQRRALARICGLGAEVGAGREPYGCGEGVPACGGPSGGGGICWAEPNAVAPPAQITKASKLMGMRNIGIPFRRVSATVYPADGSVSIPNRRSRCERIRRTESKTH